MKKRGLSGVKFVASDDHDGLKAALNAEFIGVIWQRCQCHLQRNAVKYVPKLSMRSQVSAIEMEISEDWFAGKRYLDMNVEMENESESANSKEKRIYKKKCCLISLKEINSAFATDAAPNKTTNITNHVFRI